MLTQKYFYNTQSTSLIYFLSAIVSYKIICIHVVENFAINQMLVKKAKINIFHLRLAFIPTL